MSNSGAHPDIVMHISEESTQFRNRIDEPNHGGSQIPQQVHAHKLSSQSGIMQSSHEVAILKKLLSDAMAAAAAKDGRLLELEGRVLQLEGRLRQKDVEMESLRNPLLTRGGSSDAGIADHLDRINNLVEEFAVSASVRLTDAEYQPSGRRMETAYKTSSRDVLGTPLVHALQDAPPDFEFAQLLLQFAFQSAVLNGMSTILSQFAFYTPGMPDVRLPPSVLDNAYYKRLGDEVLKGELQSSYGHWRSMTHQYLRKSYPDEKFRQRIKTFVAQRQKECYQYSLLFFKDASPSPEVFFKETSAPIKEIMEETFRLATVIRENVITRNYEAYLPKYKTPFSKGSMEAEDGDGDRTQHDRVVCITALGLSYTNKTGRPGELEQTIFKRAKVLTDDVLAEFSPPNSRSGTNRKETPWLRRFDFR